MIGDYVHDEANKFAALLLVRFATIGGTAFGLFFILKAVLGGVAA